MSKGHLEYLVFFSPKKCIFIVLNSIPNRDVLLD